MIAAVTEPVYDTATGRFLLIPQSSRILGRYNSQFSYGQNRVQVVWNRIILPDTLRSRSTTWSEPTPPAMPSWKTTSTTTGPHLRWRSVDHAAGRRCRAGRARELPGWRPHHHRRARQRAGRHQSGRAGDDRRNMNIQPTLTEWPGLPVRIITNRDLVLRPYQPLFFNKGTSR
jgi:hypothetical protein